MPAPDLSSYKVAASEVSSATKFNNLVQAVQDEFSDIDADQIPGYPGSADYYLRGDGAWTKKAAARVFHSVAQSIATATVTALAFDSERFDNDTIHDTATNNSRLTCKTAGKYLITATARFAPNATGLRRMLFRLNNAAFLAADGRVSVGAGVPTELQLTTVYDLAVNDYLELCVLQDSGGALNVETTPNASPEFAMVRVA